MKKLISMLVVLAMLMAMVPAVYAAEAVETDAYREVTISKAVELAEEASDAKYLVRGTVTEVTNATNGNMYIEDAEGNTLYIYGVYDADGVTRYDAMSTKPQVGDEVLLLGTLMTYGGTARMKNAQVKELVAGTLAETNTDTNLMLGNNELTAGRNENSEYVYVAEQTGTLYLTLRSYTCNGVEYGEQMLSFGWSLLFINGEKVDSMKETLEVTAGDTITIQMTCDYDVYVAWLYLSYEDFYVEPAGTKVNPVKLDPADCPTTTIEIPAGEEVWYELSNNFTEHFLYIYSENAYVAYEGWIGNDRGQIRVEPVDGVVTYEVWEYRICIGNTGTEAAVFELDCMIPQGAQNNPYPIETGELTVDIVAGRGAQYMAGYAPVTGTLTVTVETEDEGYWTLNLQNGGDPDSYMDDIYEYISNTGDSGNTVTIDVKQGDYITANVRLNDLDWNDCDGTVKVTFLYDGVAEEPAEPTDLVLGYTSSDVAEGKENVYTWTAEADCLFVVSPISANWTYRVDVADVQGTLRSSSDATVVGATVVKVNAGEMVTLTIGTADGAAATVEFTANPYAGDASNPAYLPLIPNEAYTAWELNADLPAGEYVYSMDILNTIFELTVNGELTTYNADPMGWDPATVVINNTQETGAVFAIEVNYPSGTMFNPSELELGYNEAEMLMFDGMSHSYVYTATEDTLLVIDLLGENWYYWGAFMKEDGSLDYARMTATYAADDADYGSPVVPVTVVKLAAGESFLLYIGTIDGSEIVEFNANIYAGDASNPAYLPLRPNEAYTAWELNADLPAGEYVYSMDILNPIFELTVNGELTTYNADPMGWDPATVVINNTQETGAVFAIEVNYPSGTMFNPSELELGYNEAEMLMFDGMSHSYVYTATEDTLLAIELMGNNWYYWGAFMKEDGSLDYARMTATYAADDADYGSPVVPMTVVKVAAGESFLLYIGTIDGTEMVEFSAMTYAGTEEDPVLFNYCWSETATGLALNADLPAGEYVYGARINGMTLTVNGVETEYVPGMGRMPCVFTINNAESGVVALEANMPVGSMDNPEIVGEGEYTTEIEPETYAEYWYSFTAPADGVLTVTVASTTGYVFVVNNETTGVYGDYQWSDDNPVNPMNVQVKSGDVIMIMVGAYDPELGMGAGATITVNLQFTEVTGVKGDVNGDGVVDSTDARQIMQYDLGLADDSNLNVALGDVNNDGVVDSTDARLIMQFDLGLIEEF